MDTETHWTRIESERRSLADLLAGLSAEQWEAPSLCTEWRVRDVAAHLEMTLHGQPTLGATLAGIARARGHLFDFGRDVAIAWADRPTDELVSGLRDRASSRTLPVVAMARNVLLDVVIHGQDIAVPLGVERPVPTDTGVAVLRRVWDMGWPFAARKRLGACTLAATDADIALGEGPVVTGPLAALILLASGRDEAALARLHGPGVELLRAGTPVDQ
ncbi:MULTISPECIES: maleylpyruvate isomerase family mycothiol-dependent enzyme [unclassified Nocardioides]|uniref:maleylpyruvate isomerase family mycothiol-dependent enzyme n=1 Tax=unclassified Nocardioides TaxID=2615069 RepID=UPI00360B7D17